MPDRAEEGARHDLDREEEEKGGRGLACRPDPQRRSAPSCPRASLSWQTCADRRCGFVWGWGVRVVYVCGEEA